MGRANLFLRLLLFLLLLLFIFFFSILAGKWEAPEWSIPIKADVTNFEWEVSFKEREFC